MKPNPFGHEFHDAHFSKMNQSQETTDAIINWRNSEKGILFWGTLPGGENIGNGKTYFCAALWNYLQEKNKNVRAYVESDYYTALKSVIKNDWDYNTEARRLCEVEWLILDDLGTSKITEFTKECIYTLVDTRLSNGLPTVITTNFTMDQIKENYTARMVSRLTCARNTVIMTNEEDRRKMIYEQ